MRNYIVTLLSVLAAALGSSTAFAQPRTGAMIVGAPERNNVGFTASHLADNMRIRYNVTNIPLQSAPHAARDLSGKATDGSVLMVVFINDHTAAKGESAAASEFSSLTPVSLLGEWPVSGGSQAWFGLFAPPGTPVSVVRSLELQVRQALADPATFKVAFGPFLVFDKSADALSRRMAASPKPKTSASAPVAADDPKGVGGGASPD
jgi:hypothetical protein